MNRAQEIATLQQRLDADAAGVVRMNPEWRTKTERRLRALRRSGGQGIKRTEWLVLLSLVYGVGAITAVDIFISPLSFSERIIGATVISAFAYGSMLKRISRRMAREAIINRG